MPAGWRAKNTSIVGAVQSNDDVGREAFIRRGVGGEKEGSEGEHTAAAVGAEMPECFNAQNLLTVGRLDDPPRVGEEFDVVLGPHPAVLQHQGAPVRAVVHRLVARGGDPGGRRPVGCYGETGEEHPAVIAELSPTNNQLPVHTTTPAPATRPDSSHQTALPAASSAAGSAITFSNSSMMTPADRSTSTSHSWPSAFTSGNGGGGSGSPSR